MPNYSKILTTKPEHALPYYSYTSVEFIYLPSNASIRTKRKSPGRDETTFLPGIGSKIFMCTDKVTGIAPDNLATCNN